MIEIGVYCILASNLGYIRHVGAEIQAENQNQENFSSTIFVLLTLTRI